jgi:hypothetical protein
MTVMVVCLQVSQLFRDLCQMQSEPLRPQQGVGEIKQQTKGNETGERIIEDHGHSSGAFSARNGYSREKQVERQSRSQA